MRRVLFPYARARLAEYVTHDDAAVRDAVAETRRLVPGQDPLTTLLHWADQDAKIAPLKAIQGAIWRDGFAAGAFMGEFYADVPPALRRWAGGGVRLYAYSAGSVEAQKVLFANAHDGDLSGLFSGHFDTRLGSMREPDSYSRIAIAIGVPTVEVLFLTDAEEELDAAATAGLRTCQLARPGEGVARSDRHPVAADFADVATLMDLPRVG